MSGAASKKAPEATVLSLAQLLTRQPASAPPCLVEPGLLPPQGILFVGGEPKVGKSLLVANLALSLAAGSGRTGFSIPPGGHAASYGYRRGSQSPGRYPRYRPSALRASGNEPLPRRRQGRCR